MHVLIFTLHYTQVFCILNVWTHTHTQMTFYSGFSIFILDVIIFNVIFGRISWCVLCRCERSHWLIVTCWSSGKNIYSVQVLDINEQIAAAQLKFVFMFIFKNLCFRIVHHVVDTAVAAPLLLCPPHRPSLRARHRRSWMASPPSERPLLAWAEWRGWWVLWVLGMPLEFWTGWSRRRGAPPALITTLQQRLQASLCPLAGTSWQLWLE